MVSSLPDANHFPEAAHLTTSTGPLCMVSVQRLFGGPFSSSLEERIGEVDHIRILASRFQRKATISTTVDVEIRTEEAYPGRQLLYGCRLDGRKLRILTLASVDHGYLSDRIQNNIGFTQVCCRGIQLTVVSDPGWFGEPHSE
jgi:hypothetical protein